MFRTNKNAPNYHLVKIHIENPEEDKREILISEHERDVLEWAELVYNDKLILCYIQDVKVCVLYLLFMYVCCVGGNRLVIN